MRDMTQISLCDKIRHHTKYLRQKICKLYKYDVIGRRSVSFRAVKMVCIFLFGGIRDALRGICVQHRFFCT